MHAEHQDGQSGFLGLDQLDQVDTAASRHRHVENHYAPFLLPHLVQDFFSVASFSAYAQVSMGGQYLLQPLAHDGMVVCDQDIDIHACARIVGCFGMKVSTLTPDPASLNISITPSSILTLSRIPIKP